MLKFNWVSFKNFISYGNTTTTVDLSAEGITAISGNSGNGKSSIIEAIVFGLFGRGYRAFTKQQIVNWTNKKNCLVEVEVEVGNDTVLIRRGIKPNVFSYSVNGVEVPEMPDVRDYQKSLETLLGVSYKTFVQTILIGTTSYVPFMQLSTQDRRNLIDSILRLGTFADMKNSAKSELSALNLNLSNVQMSIDHEERVITRQQATVNNLVESSKNVSNDIDSKIASLNIQIESNTLEREALRAELSTKMDELAPLSDRVENMYTKIVGAKAKYDFDIGEVNKTKSFFTTNDSCPVCAQNITHDHKETILGEVLSKEDRLTSFNGRILEKLAEYKQLKADVDVRSVEIRSIENKISSLGQAISSARYSITQLEENKKVTSHDDLIEQCRADIESSTRTLEMLRADREVILDSIGVVKNVIEILGDDGVRSFVIDKYLPYFEQRINQILADTNLDITIKFDTGFSETIYTQRRDETTYSAISQGERKRVDLAILFVLGEIAASTSASTSNIIFIDEIIDHGLDPENLQYFMDMLGEKNVFLISHNQQIIEQADHLYKVKKDPHGFSILEKSS